MRLATTLFSLTLLGPALLAPGLLAHGGIGVVPSDAGGGGGGDGGTVAPPTNPGGANQPTPGFGGSSGDGTTGTTRGTTRGTSARRDSGRPGGRGGMSSGDDFSGPTVDGWEFWWQCNRDTWLDLRSRLAARGVTSGTLGLLTRRGNEVRDADTRRPRRQQVIDEVTPTLRAMLGASEADIADSALLALARSAELDGSGDDLAAVVGCLAHPALSVRSSAALALGVLGDPRAAATLIDLAADTSRGRQLVGGGRVESLVREFAALAMGMLADDDCVDALTDLLLRLGPSDRDLRVAAALGLSQLPADHRRAGVVVGLLAGLLGDRRQPPQLLAHVVTALAKVGGRAAVPELLSRLADRDADAMVRQSAAQALGRVGMLADAGVLDTLMQVVKADRDALTRHYALLALGRVGGRDDDPLLHAEAHDAIEALLRKELAGDGKQRSHRSWAAFSAALYVRTLDDAVRRDRLVERMALAFEHESDPSFGGAFAVALGLAGAKSAGAQLLDKLRGTADEALLGHLAVALGLLGEREAGDDLLRLCARQSTSPELRRQAATGLGLLGEGAAVDTLLAALQGAPTLGVSAGAASALGMLGDREALRPLLVMCTDGSIQPLTRGFAVAALGLLSERGSRPFHAALKADLAYRVSTPALAELMDLL